MGMRTLLLAAFVICWSSAADAQWADSRIEHDWRLTVGESSFGLVQTAVYVTDLEHANHRMTTIHFGRSYAKTTRFTAVQIAVFSLVLIVAGGAYVVRRLSPGKEKP